MASACGTTEKYIDGILNVTCINQHMALQVAADIGNSEHDNFAACTFMCMYTYLHVNALICTITLMPVK